MAATAARVDATLSYSLNAQEAAQAVGANTDADGAIWGTTVRGRWGAFYVQGDYA